MSFLRHLLRCLVSMFGALRDGSQGSVAFAAARSERERAPDAADRPFVGLEPLEPRVLLHGDLDPLGLTAHQPIGAGEGSAAAIFEGERPVTDAESEPLQESVLQAPTMAQANGAEFTIGDRVKVSASQGLIVRDGPAGSELHAQPYGETGSIIDGPEQASLGGTTYTWYAVDWNNNWSGWSVEAGMSQVPVDLSTPSLIMPEDNANDVSQAPGFGWHDVAGADGYWLTVAEDAADLPTDPYESSRPNITISGSTSLLTHVAGSDFDLAGFSNELDEGTTYHWQVQAFELTGENATRLSPYSEQWSFTTEAEAHAPTVSLAATLTAGDAPLEVDFTATASVTGSTIVSYWWDFNGDGEIDEVSVGDDLSNTASFIYEGSGTYNAEVTAVAQTGLDATDTVTVTVGGGDQDSIAIPDHNLRAAIRDALGLDGSSPITEAAMGSLIALTAPDAGIEDLTGLEYAEGLEWLRLESNEITDLTPLAGLTNLQTLDLWANSISNIGPLAGLSDVQWLRLDSNQITDVSPLAGLTELEMLRLDGNDITDVSSLAGLTNLHTIDLRSNNVGAVTALQGMTELEWLSLGSNEIADVSPLANLTDVRVLDLESNNIGSISALAGMTELQWLTLAKNDITDVTPLAGLTELDTLDLWSNNIDDVSPLAGLTGLQWLGLSSNAITDPGPLSGLTELELLSLGSNQITDVSPLSGLTNLTFLNLGHNAVVEVDPLAGLTNLEELRLGSNQIVSINPLSELTDLHSLTLYSNEIADVSPLAGLNSLEFVDVRWNGLDITPGSATAAIIDGLQSQGATVLYQPQEDELGPAISTLSPDPIVGSNEPQPLHIHGSNFAEDDTVRLRDLDNDPPDVHYDFSTTERADRFFFHDASHIEIHPILTTAAAAWSVEVISSDGQSSGETPFTVVTSDVSTGAESLLDAIEDAAASHYNPSWDATEHQFKAWLATIALGEGGAGGYVAHSQGAPGSDVFNHVTLGSAFRFSTGLGPFQIDRGSPFAWDTWPSIDKLDVAKTADTTARHHGDFRPAGSTLADFASDSPWFAVDPAQGGDPAGLWAQLTGTQWADHANGSNENLEWSEVRQRIEEFTLLATADPEQDIVSLGPVQWRIGSAEGEFLDDGRPLVVEGEHETWLITARDGAGSPLFRYYYTNVPDAGIEVWIYDDEGAANEPYRHGFVRDYAGPDSFHHRAHPQGKAGDSAAGFTLNSPAIGDATEPQVPQNVLNARVAMSQADAATNTWQGNLAWTAPDDPNWEGVLIVQSLEEFTGEPQDGEQYAIGGPLDEQHSGLVVYAGDDELFVDGGLVPGVSYIYTAFSYNSEYEYSEATRFTPMVQRTSADSIPEQSDTATNLVFVTHGWNSSADTWVNVIANEVASHTILSSEYDDWDVWAFDWSGPAGEIDPRDAFVNASIIGQPIGEMLAGDLYDYDHIHLIAHSAGAMLTDVASRAFPAPGLESRNTTIHATFLDAYRADDVNHGRNANWAEHYFNNNDLFNTNDPSRGAYNLDVTAADPDPGGPFDRHTWPHRWYLETIRDPTNSRWVATDGSGPWGFAKSLAYGRSALPSHQDYPRFDPDDPDDPDDHDVAFSHTTNGTFNSGLDNWGAADDDTVMATTQPRDPDHYMALMTTASPVTLSQQVTTPAQPFGLSFDYEFFTTTGELEVMLDSVALGTFEAPDELADEWSSFTVEVSDPSLRGLSEATLEFRLDGLTGSQVGLTNIVLAAIPQEPPTAEASVSDIDARTTAPHEFTITYDDDLALDVTTIIDNDDAFIVLGPDGFSEPAIFVSIDDATDGTPRTATYRLQPPTGGWTSRQNGTYVVAPHMTPVMNTNGGALEPMELGAFDVSIPGVVSENVFYNNSAFDGGQAGPGPHNDAALAPEHRGVLPGEQAGAVNYTNAMQGLTGITVDVAGLAQPGQVDLDTFTFRVGNDNDFDGWELAPTPNHVHMREGQGSNGSDRIELIWPDHTIENQWLEVMVNANDVTGLAEDDVFYFGHRAGDVTGDGQVTAEDVALIRENQSGFGSTDIDNVYDIHRTGRVDLGDVIAARNSQGTPPLEMITPPAQASGSLAPAQPASLGTMPESTDTPQTQPARSPTNTSLSALEPTSATAAIGQGHTSPPMFDALAALDGSPFSRPLDRASADWQGARTGIGLMQDPFGSRSFGMAMDQSRFDLRLAPFSDDEQEDEDDNRWSPLVGGEEAMVQIL